MFTFQERSPPILDDFLYICDDAYNRPEMLRTEIDVLKTIDFDLGIPLSYRFLRRYAKVLPKLRSLSVNIHNGNNT